MRSPEALKMLETPQPMDAKLLTALYWLRTRQEGQGVGAGAASTSAFDFQVDFSGTMGVEAASPSVATRLIRSANRRREGESVSGSAVAAGSGGASGSG